MNEESKEVELNIDYTKLDYFNQTFCPHCGKILKGKNHCIGGIGYDDEYGFDDSYIYETFKCKDCNISASTEEYHISDIRAWKFPKDYKVSVTRKQTNYIKYLSNHFKCIRDTPIITNKELATKWIGQFVKLLEEEKREDLYIKDITAVFEKYGYDYCGVCHNDDKDLRFSNKHSFEEHYSPCLSIYYNKETKTYTAGSQSGILDSNTLPIYISIISKVPEDMEKILKEIELIPYPNEQTAKDKLEQDKQDFKDRISRYYPPDYDDYGMYPEMDDPFN